MEVTAFIRPEFTPGPRFNGRNILDVRWILTLELDSLWGASHGCFAPHSCRLKHCPGRQQFAQSRQLQARRFNDVGRTWFLNKLLD